MIDTVQIAHVAPVPPEKEMFDRVFIPMRTKCGGIKYVRNFDGVSLTWSPPMFGNGAARLYALASLPKLLFGNNVQELDGETIPAALLKLSEYVSDVAGIPFDPFSAIVTRVDYCRNPRLKDNLDVAIWNNALRNRSVSSFKTLPFDWNGVYFRNRGKALNRQICCYSKYTQVCDEKESAEVKESATGIYRIEPRFRSTAAIKSLMKRMSITAPTSEKLLTSDVSKAVISEASVKLGLNKPLVNASTREKRLVEVFGINKAFAVAGYLEMRERVGRDFLEREMKRATFYRYEAMIKESGILSVTDRAELPPLITD